MLPSAPVSVVLSVPPLPHVFVHSNHYYHYFLFEMKLNFLFPPNLSITLSLSLCLFLAFVMFDLIVLQFPYPFTIPYVVFY